MTLTLVGTRKSRSFRPLWCLEELGLDYTHRVALPRSDEVRALNPVGKIPVLIDGDDAIADSTAIVAYLTDRAQQLTATPGTIARARQDAMTFRLLDEFDALMWTAARHSFVLPEDQRVPAIKDSLKWEFARACEAIARDMTGPFVMGDDLTVPDFILAHCLGWAMTAKFQVPEGPLTEYFAIIRTRPAYVTAAAKP